MSHILTCSQGWEHFARLRSEANDTWNPNLPLLPLLTECSACMHACMQQMHASVCLDETDDSTGRSQHDRVPLRSLSRPVDGSDCRKAKSILQAGASVTQGQAEGVSSC